MASGRMPASCPSPKHPARAGCRYHGPHGVPQSGIYVCFSMNIPNTDFFVSFFAMRIPQTGPCGAPWAPLGLPNGPKHSALARCLEGAIWPAFCLRQRPAESGSTQVAWSIHCSAAEFTTTTIGSKRSSVWKTRRHSLHASHTTGWPSFAQSVSELPLRVRLRSEARRL